MPSVVKNHASSELKLVENEYYGRAGFGVFKCQREKFLLPGLLGVRIGRTGFGPHFIHGAKIVIAQKRAGHIFKNKVSVFINPEVERCKFCRLQSEVAGYTAYVAVFQSRPQCTAAICTLKAIDTLKSLVV